jgi:hypothetical protein
MKIIKTFEDFISAKVAEAALRAGEESDIYIDDVQLDSGKTVSAAEILGAITAYPTEKEFKKHFYDTFGEGSFGEGEIDQIVKFFNDFKAEQAEKEKEEEKDAEGEEGGEDDPLAGI